MILAGKKLLEKDFSNADQKRFWAAVDKTAGPDGCWPWRLARHACGYGVFNIVLRGRRTTLRASRVSYALANGCTPAGELVMHSCDNPACCNPKHLDAGTPKQNTQHMISVRRNAPMPDIRGENNGSARLTPEKVRAIRLDTRPHAIIAVDYGVSQVAISCVKRGKTWSHV